MGIENIEELTGKVSLGIELRTDVECPKCGNNQANVTHNGEGEEVLCCNKCQKFWKVET